MSGTTASSKGATKLMPVTFSEAGDKSTAISEQFKSSNPDHRVELEEVELKDLYIDPEIQRSVETGEVASIAARFNPNALGTLTLAARVNRLANGNSNVVLSLLDGLQRTTAAQKVGYEGPFRALVHYGLTRAEEAQLFLDLNFRRSVGAWRRFKTRVVAEDPQALGIMQILKDVGVPMGGVKGFSAIATADKIWAQQNGPARLRWALQIVHDIYDDDGRGHCYDGRVLEAFALLHHHFLPSIDEARLVDKLTLLGGGVSKLIGHGATIRTIEGGQIAPNIADAIVYYYNRHKRQNPNYPTRLPKIPRRKASTRIVIVDDEPETGEE